MHSLVKICVSISTADEKCQSNSARMMMVDKMVVLKSNSPTKYT